MMLKSIHILVFLFCTVVCFSQKRSVAVKLSYLEPYCGGARPTKEIEEQAKTPKPFANKNIIIVSESGKVRCAMTDALGSIKLKLKPGKYNLYEDWRYYKQVPYKLSEKEMDMTCLKLEWSKELITLIVGSKKNEIDQKYELVVHCPWAIPCLLDSSRPPAQ